MSKAEEKKRHILESANRLLIAKGMTDITIDEVAQEAGYSKGGITYYFDSKDHLLVSLAKMLDEDYLKRIEQGSQLETEITGNWSRALLKISKQDLAHTTVINNALIASALANQNVEQSLADSFEVIQNKVSHDGYDPILATIMRLAIDGLYYAELFKAPPLESELEQAVFKRLESWTKESQ